MMDDLISKKGLLNKINAYVCGSQDKEFICKLIAEMPTIDAVEVVRCYKCIHWDEDTVRRNSNDATWWNEAVCRKYSDEMREAWKDADWFCADGERKDNE